MKREIESEDDVGAEEPVSSQFDWEDIPDKDVSPERLDSFDAFSATFTDASKPSFFADTTWRIRAAPPRLKRKKSSIVDKEKIKEVLFTVAHHSSVYILSVLLQTMRLMHTPLSAILFLCMLSFMMTRLSGVLSTSFAPICHLPLVSESALCALLDPNALHIPKWADFPQLMQVQSSSFEQLLDVSFGGSGLSLEIQKVELATTELAKLVQHSHLKSYDVVAAKFIKDAKKTARRLTRLSSKIGGAIDNLITVNRYAMRTIENAVKNAPPPYSLTALIPFRTGPTTQEVVVGAFSRAMDTFSLAIQRLIREVEVSLHNLDILEEDLSAVSEAASHKDSVPATNMKAFFDSIVDDTKRFTLLQDLHSYRKQAQTHVAAALETLHSMREDMEDLRERVAVSELVDGHIPLQVHIESIQTGLQRLQEGRVRVKEREEEVLGIGA
ncbi:hypothetical protein DFH29DRAFT_231359 [Suillus ampliporus]|nr:hypothetical protein DFH29DRAFT_231359 [Suillus ampliporus]